MTSREKTPPGWVRTELSAISGLVRGVSYQKADASDAHQEGLVPILRATNITESGLTFNQLVWVPDKYVSHEQMLLPGDIVVATSSGSAAIVGKAAELRRAWFGSFGAFCTVVRPSEEMDPIYVAYYLKTPEYRQWATKTARGSNINNLKTRNLLSLSFPLAPRNEQTRISQKLDELLSELDDGVNELVSARTKLSLYRKSLLKSAVEGRLTAEWRSKRKASEAPAESGKQLLARILEERRKRWEAKQLAKYKAQKKDPPKNWRDRYPEPVVPDSSEMPTLPQDWCWASLDQIGEIASGVAKGSRYPEGTKLREVPYLRVANVQRGYLDLTEVKTIRVPIGDIKELVLQPGDILFNEGGDIDKLGRGWVWKGQIANCIHQNHVFRHRPVLLELMSEFFSHCGNTYGQKWFLDNGKQTTNLASINLTTLRRFPVPLPPAGEQQQILAMLDEALAETERHANEFESRLKLCAAHRQQLLTEAFSGRLVSQDPNDESAHELLERIKIAREEAEAKRKAKPFVARKAKEVKTVKDILDVLGDRKKELSAQQLLAACGLGGASEVYEIEQFYLQLRNLERAKKVNVRRKGNEDLVILAKQA